MLSVVPLREMNVKHWVTKNLLLLSTFSGVVFGVVLGLSLRQLDLDETIILLLSYPGELFIRVLKLMILPLVIASLIAGSASLNSKMNGKIVARTVSYFLATSLLNSILGILLAIAIHPGSPLTRQVQTVYTTRNETIKSNTTDGEFITVLQRVVKYRAGTNTLGIIAFCLVFGTVLGSLGKKAATVIDFFSIVDEVILKIVNGIMWLSPLGVASIILSKILAVENLSTVISNLGLFIVSIILGVFIYQIIIQNVIYFILVRKNPFVFYFNLLEPWMTSFATASTAATLPITFKCMNDKCKVDPRISRFVLPIGATVNMDGTALFVSIASIFIAQMTNTHLTIGQYATIADRFRTTNNCLGDCYTAAVVEKWSKNELNEMDLEAQQSSYYNQYDIEKAVDIAPLVSPHLHEDIYESTNNVTTVTSEGRASNGITNEKVEVHCLMNPPQSNRTTKI